MRDKHLDSMVRKHHLRRRKQKYDPVFFQTGTLTCAYFQLPALKFLNDLLIPFILGFEDDAANPGALLINTQTRK